MRLVNNLKMEGHECRHVADIGMAKAMDSQIVDIAKANKEVIITHDLDYGHLLAFSGETSPSVIIIRTRNTHAKYVFQHLINNWAEMEGPLSEGAIVVLEDTTIRIRLLKYKESKASFQREKERERAIRRI